MGRILSIPVATLAVLASPALVAQAETAPSLPEAGAVTSDPNEAVRDTEPADPNRARVTYDGGLTVTSADRRFQLSPGLWVQMLDTLTHDDSAEPETTHGLEVRRARLVLAGHAFGEHNRFYVQLGLSPGDVKRVADGVTHSPIFDAYFDFTHLRDLTLRIGQYRVPFSRQRVVPFGNLALVDRSATNFEFNLDRDLGAHLRSDDLFDLDRLRYHAGVFMGEGRDARGTGSLGLLYVIRMEALPLGTFQDYSLTDLERTPGLNVSIGAAYAFLNDGKGNRGVLGPAPTDGGTTDSHHFTGDMLIKVSGVTLLFEGHYREGTREYGDATVSDGAGTQVPAPREAPRRGAGWVTQGDVLLGDLPVDVAVRYGQIRGLGSDSSLPDNDEIGGGVGWFIAKRAYRLQADYFHRYPAGTPEAGTDELRVSVRLGF